MKIKIPKTLDYLQLNAFQLAKIIAWKDIYVPRDLRKKYKIKGIVDKKGDLKIILTKRKNEHKRKNV